MITMTATEYHKCVGKAEKVKAAHFDLENSDMRTGYQSAGGYLPSVEEFLEYKSKVPEKEYIQYLIYYENAGIYDERHPEDEKKAEEVHQFAQKELERMLEVKNTRKEKSVKEPAKHRGSKVKLTYDEYDRYFEKAENLASNIEKFEEPFKSHLIYGTFPTVEELLAYGVDAHFRKYLVYLIYFREPSLYKGNGSEEFKRTRRFLIHLFEKQLILDE